jgi:hypothetical protein|nr:MAG TPA: hypothetical protein [Caudoviricetes sp.]
MISPFDKILIEEMEADDLQAISADRDDPLDAMAEDLSPREEAMGLFPLSEDEEGVDLDD